MAKLLLSRLAVDFIVASRDDKSKTYTWSEIADMVNEKFNTNVTWQAVSYRYHSYKKHKANMATDDPQQNQSSEKGSEQSIVNKPVLPESRPEPENDPATLLLGTGVKEAEPEPLSEKTNTDPVVGDSEKNQPKPRFGNSRKFGIGDTLFKHNETASPELLKLLGIENT